ncbi:hypothetical protein TURU_017482 [Turdus rufiventris]|nr:hypothetical protein TURU_017482 [Turdus rufiventris]
MLIDKKSQDNPADNTDLQTKKPKFILSCIKRVVISREKEVTLLKRRYLECCIQLWLQHKDNLLERVQRRATNMIRGQKQISLDMTDFRPNVLHMVKHNRGIKSLQPWKSLTTFEGDKVNAKSIVSIILMNFWHNFI